MPETQIQIALIRQELDAVKVALEDQNQKLSELLAAWQTANGVLSFFKLLGGLAVAGTAILGFVKGWKL